MTEAEKTKIVSELLSTLHNNVVETKDALRTAKLTRDPGFVWVWPQYWLAVKLLDNGQTRGVGVAHATVTSSYDKRVFTNGKDEAAVLMPLIGALEGALKHGLEVQADMIERMGKQA
jgi:hypothetical protein